MNHKYKFNWGDSVKVASSAPRKYLSICEGSVCGIRQIDNKLVAADFEESVGSVLYLVESSTGEAIEIPERFLIIFS
jgi:hypothetical protein